MVELSLLCNHGDIGLTTGCPSEENNGKTRMIHITMLTQNHQLFEMDHLRNTCPKDPQGPSNGGVGTCFSQGVFGFSK